MALYILGLVYLLASVTFILGLKMLSSPETAKKGNTIAAIGMGLAILATLFFNQVEESEMLMKLLLILAGIGVGSIIGTVMALRVKMTAMPQMVSFFNGMGGACAAVIGIVEYLHLSPATDLFNGHVAVILAGLIIGGVSFSGSMVAYGKLEGLVTEKSVALPGQAIINGVIMLGIIGLAIFMMSLSMPAGTLVAVLVLFTFIYGVLFVLPIGGADMPVVISLLNSFTGVAAGLAGFIYGNQVMITGGILVGAAGMILTLQMCKAMNRSLSNVIIGSFGGVKDAGEGGKEAGAVKEISVSDAAIMLSYSPRVMIIPGFGLAVAQAQHACHELGHILEDKGVEVKYAIHPVAGRMPGHMNVLLAEADVPYDNLLEMEEANSEMDKTDVTLVIGANDVVNPAAKKDPASPIYGMPILDVERSRNILIIKRSMRSGYAGIENEIFFHDKTKMLFGDAKDMIQQLISEVKAS